MGEDLRQTWCGLPKILPPTTHLHPFTWTSWLSHYGASPECSLCSFLRLKNREKQKLKNRRKTTKWTFQAKMKCQLPKANPPLFPSEHSLWNTHLTPPTSHPLRLQGGSCFNSRENGKEMPKTHKVRGESTLDIHLRWHLFIDLRRGCCFLFLRGYGGRQMRERKRWVLSNPGKDTEFKGRGARGDPER